MFQRVPDHEGVSGCVMEHPGMSRIPQCDRVNKRVCLWGVGNEYLRVMGSVQV